MSPAHSICAALLPNLLVRIRLPQFRDSESHAAFAILIVARTQRIVSCFQPILYYALLQIVITICNRRHRRRAAHSAVKRYVYTPSAKAAMRLLRLLRSLQSTTMLCFAIEGSISHWQISLLRRGISCQPPCTDWQRGCFL